VGPVVNELAASSMGMPPPQIEAAIQITLQRQCERKGTSGKLRVVFFEDSCGSNSENDEPP